MPVKDPESLKARETMCLQIVMGMSTRDRRTETGRRETRGNGRQRKSQRSRTEVGDQAQDSLHWNASIAPASEAHPEPGAFVEAAQAEE